MNLHMMGLNDDNNTDEQGPLGNEMTNEPGFGAVSESGAKKTTVLHGFGALAIVVVVGVGVLFGMRKLGMGGLIDMPEIDIDYPIDQADAGKSTEQAKGIISDLNASGDIDQVPLDEITQNPFEWKGLVASVDDDTPAVVDPAELARQRAQQAAEQRRQEIANAFESLTLNGVMGSGKTAVARISGELVREGDTVSDMFKVTAIDGRSVKLIVDGQYYTLALGE